MRSPELMGSQRIPRKETASRKSTQSPQRSLPPPEKGNLKDNAEDGIAAGKKSGNPVTEPIPTKEPIQKDPKSQAHNKPQIGKLADREKPQEENHQYKHQATQTTEMDDSGNMEKDQGSDDSFWDAKDPTPREEQEK